MQDRLAAALAARKSDGLLRTLRPLQPGGPGHVRRDGRELIDLSSNDYLGLARHPALIERSRQWTEALGTGSRASRLITGTLDQHEAIEAKLAAFKGSEAALLFASGWQTNASIFKALVKLAPDTVIFADELIHASMHLGIAAAGKRQVRFAHNDLDELERLLAEQGPGAEKRFIVTESVFSMDGDRCDLVRLSEIAKRHDAYLIVDEAHATGVLGPRGARARRRRTGSRSIWSWAPSARRSARSAPMSPDRRCCAITSSMRAAGSSIRPRFLRRCSGRSTRRSTWCPAWSAERAHLAALAARMRGGLQALGFDTAGSDTQIIPLIVGGEEETLALARRLEERGLLAVAIRPPTVPRGTSRIRFALSSVHTDEDVDRLLEALGSAA